MNFNFSGAPMSSARKMANQSERAVRHAARDMAGSAHDASDAAMQAVSRYYDQGRHSVMDSARDLEHYVEQRPVRSTLVALGIGCLVCALLIDR